MSRVYSSLLRPILFQLNSEAAHEFALAAGRIGGLPGFRSIISGFYGYRDPRLEVTVAGITFPNPVGLAAGMDKRGEVIPFFDALGFGSIEIGSVTLHPQSGNPKPRMFRIPPDLAIINRMGFPSPGVAAMKGELEHLRGVTLSSKIGINIGKSKITPLDDAVTDYLSSFESLREYGDYFAINVSSPNTPELRKLQEKPRLKEIFAALRTANPAKKPFFVKVAPDLTSQELSDVCEVVFEEGISGIIATNTTISRDGLSVANAESGGLSGRPLREKSLQILRELASITEGKIPLIAVGGIFTSDDVIESLRAGAALVQIYTSFVYEGPAIVSTILKGLSSTLDYSGAKDLAELVAK